MATPNKNAKSQLTTVRVPHDVMEGMEEVKQDGESNAGFIVTAMRGEIARRQLKESGEEKTLTRLNAALSALEKIEKVGVAAGDNLRELVAVAQSEIHDIKGCSAPENNPPAPQPEKKADPAKAVTAKLPRLIK